VRLDKWLWAARLFKTRSLASDAVAGGRVKLNGASVKPAKEVRIGDRLSLHCGDDERELFVAGLAEQRRPAPEAQLLYQETDESRQRRALAAELRKLAPTPAAEQKGRPSKRDRRQVDRLLGS
jgi:ribosome-associated heat shock protein Hsp15